ncbi:sugar phosphate isomerase/epimerase family protein [Sphingobium sp. CAP-1]|uniref:sugar phosphate isomerase/epimerase family protein n=1 Tax=Sphingobium sp. CAP-1 TaxID=2676077 RepID=UPI0012BB2043|nr:TIM barrel protein [Sphingobium sp. CAP-1]QGP78047.1 TIM barrel protein [Sphingobium sp. CAP-1]
MKRRDFLVGTIAMATAGCATAPHAGGMRKRDWGVQLFTVGTLLEQDFEGTLRQVAALGYKEVETVGSFGRDPAWLRAQLDRFGLTSPSQHIASDAVYASFGAWTRKEISTEQNRENYERAFQPDKALALVEDGIGKAKLLGQRYVTWPILMPRMLADRAILDRYIGIFNQAGRMCRDAGLTFAFHNHHREFQRLGSDMIYDLILKGTDPDLVKMELDFYWVTKAGHDPIPYFQNNPGRYFGCHVKDVDAAGEFAVVGTGRLDLPRLIGAARKAGVEHFFVEYDRSDDPMGAIRDSMAYLKRLPA